MTAGQSPAGGAVWSPRDGLPSRTFLLRQRLKARGGHLGSSNERGGGAQGEPGRPRGRHRAGAGLGGQRGGAEGQLVQGEQGQRSEQRRVG